LSRFLPFFCLFIYVAVATVGAFVGGLWAALGIALALVFWVSASIADKKIILPSRDMTILALLTLFVFVAELPLSLDNSISIKTWARLVSIFVPLLFLTAPQLQKAAFHKAFVPVLAVAVLTSSLFLGLELQSGGAILHAVKKMQAPLTEYNRGMAHLVILAFPLFAGLWVAKGKKVCMALGIVLLYPASLTESHTAKLALLVGLACVAAAFYRPVWVRNLLAFASVAFLGWPFYAQWIFVHDYSFIEKLHPSWQHRMEIWDYLSYRIGDRPIFGWGLGTTHLLDVTQPHGDLYHYAIQAAPHAHNFITELWVETGLPGLALGLGFLLLSLKKAYGLHENLRPFALGGWAAAVIVSLFGFDFWTDALWAAFTLSAFIFGMLQQRMKSGFNFFRV